MDIVNMKTGELAVLPNGEALSASGSYLPFAGADERCVLLLENTGSSDTATITIAAGDGLQAAEELTYTLAAGKTAALTLESGRVKKLTGEHKNTLFVKCTGTVQARVLQLP